MTLLSKAIMASVLAVFVLLLWTFFTTGNWTLLALTAYAVVMSLGAWSLAVSAGIAFMRKHKQVEILLSVLSTIPGAPVQVIREGNSVKLKYVGDTDAEPTVH